MPRVSNFLLLLVCAAAFGYGAGLYPFCLGRTGSHVFRGLDMRWVVAILIAAWGIGGAIGPWVGGYIFDNSWSYTSAFTFAAVGFVLSYLFLWIGLFAGTAGRSRSPAGPRLDPVRHQ